MSDAVERVADPIDLDAHRTRRDDRGETAHVVVTPAGAVVPVAETSSDAAYEVVLDDDETTDAELRKVLVPVDSPALPVAVAEGARVPIVPVHLRPENLRVTVRRALERAGHVALFHAVRAPWYGCKLSWFAGRGFTRLVRSQLRWWWVPNSFALEQKAADAGELKEWEKIHRQLKATRLWRGAVLTGQNLGLLIGAPIAWNAAPAAGLAAVGAAAVAGLAHYGRPAGQTLVGTAVVAPRFRKLNSDIVLRAYYAAGLGNPNRADQEVRFGSAMSRDARNTGSQVLVDLPYGKGWSDVAGAREKIASGLDVHVNQVFLTPDKTSSRRHMLFVADRDPLAVPVGRTDMLDCKPRSVWQPVRFGKDERDALVRLKLMWSSLLVGAQPRKGKTFAARLVALHAALDPWVKLIVADGKNSPDWLAFRKVAHRMVFGTHPNPNDDDPIEHLRAILDEVLAHIDKVNSILTTLPVDMCPDGKLTEELARDPRYPDLRVLVLVMEEFQVYFETEDQAVNKEIAAKLSRIQAVGPSAGVVILSSSQKPSGVGAGDVGRLFNRYRDNHSTRFALKCGNRIVSEAVLGGDAYAEGFDASSLPVGDEYRGVGYLYGATDETPTVRTFLADASDADKILTAARQHRERLGTLTGQAAGEELERASRDVLADVLTVMGPDNAAHWDTIAGRLAQQMPEQYDGTTPEAISAQARALHVPSVNVKRDGAVRKGVKADDLRAAMARRDGTTT
ncbi:cell divisionFtsK/SpoIIIE [Kribbella flavida DSM 17836]|uniref:Cell divisionFtsK/SpoIIIE n=1 Tax=Kribbella flavida (strain DSM 17836 / JCM 10339 / NBRC 14399) TaxID=479435 RepID=D2PKT6_KRIFD|nr:cell division protein FtsK [Kribbella flavida]ADB32403.1 cell divisionFtsK/SpoIIIE [Kribbella flavida DSM 17836]